MTNQTEKLFRHYKGKHYRLITDKAVMPAIGEAAVVYQSISTGEFHVTGYNDFYGIVINNGEEVDRFAELD